MSVTSFFIKRHDTAPALRVTLLDADAAIDLSSASAVRYTMWFPGGALKVERAAAVVIDAEAGIVEYRWQEGDTDSAGRFYCDWEIAWGDGTVQTVPSDGHDVVVITPDGDGQ